MVSKFEYLVRNYQFHIHLYNLLLGFLVYNETIPGNIINLLQDSSILIYLPSNLVNGLYIPKLSFPQEQRKYQELYMRIPQVHCMRKF